VWSSLNTFCPYVCRPQFFAFFGYEPKAGKAGLQSKKAKDYTSHCDRTMVGWFHGADNKNWGCFRAQKKGVAAWSPPQFESNAHNHLDSSDVVAPVHLLEVASSTNAGVDATMFVADQDLVDAVNEDADNMWQAHCPAELEGKSLLEVHSMVGQSSFHKERDSLFAAARSVHSDSERIAQKLSTGSYLWGTADAEMETEHGLPHAVDWRSKYDEHGHAQDFTAPARSQGHCGSCYAMAIAAAAESRIRIKSGNKDKAVISPQQMLSCSNLNQGCLGGYPFLLAKHAHEQGLVPESCMSYRPVKGHQPKCAAACQDSDVYYAAADYGYIGGYYGASSEAAMMKEVATNGPIVVALQVPRSLFYYQDGIFHARKHKHHGRVEPGWEETNHAVTVVGYGVDDSKKPPVKYWIVRNSWGPKWGDAGHFKIVRGVDECSIESMPVAMRMTHSVSRANMKSKRPQFIATMSEVRQAQALRDDAADRTAHGESQCVDGSVCPAQ
jgi:hypothetical protein